MRHGDAAGPSLHEARGNTAGVDDPRIVKYLQGGKIYVATPGPSVDVLDEKRPKIAPAHVMTDGAYSWPGDLSYYVQRYHVRLPDDFVAHMAANRWVVPEVDVVALQKAEELAKRHEQGDDGARQLVQGDVGVSEKPRTRTAADAGYELCPSCSGGGSCKWCGGSGQPLTATSKSCDGCAGTGKCVLCDGEGQLVTGHYAFAEWEKRTTTTNASLTVEDRALSEKMHANQMKYMQRRAEQGPPKALPKDSPILAKWAHDEFLSGPPSALPDGPLAANRDNDDEEDGNGSSSR